MRVIHRWTVEEDDLLREKYKQNNRSSVYISGILGVTRDAVKCRASRLGLGKINTRRKWTKEEDNKLSVLLEKYTIASIAVRLHRSVCAIARRTTYLKVSRMNRVGWYTQQETCEILGVTHRMLDKYMGDGRLIATREGRHWRIKESEIKRFLRTYPLEFNGRNVDLLQVVHILAGVITE